jgi:hypothetical protein
MRISYRTEVKAARVALADTAVLLRNTVILTKSAVGGILRLVEEVKVDQAVQVD